MTESLISGYWAPAHQRPGDLDYFRRAQPRDVLILDPDVQDISNVYMACPNTYITLRRWEWDDGRSDQSAGIYPLLAEDPEGYARWLVERYRKWLVELETQARQRGIPFPDREQLVAHHANEPDTNNLLPQINRSNAVAARLFREELGMSMDGLNLGTGHVALLNAHGEPDWEPLSEALDAIVRYDQFAVTHEYCNDLPMTDPSVYPWHVGRHAKWAPRGPRWKIGEFGLEMLLNGRRNQHHGWIGIASPGEMIARIRWYLSITRDDVEAVRIYMTDYRDRLWSSFDTEPLHDALVTMAWAFPWNRAKKKDNNLFLPSTPQPGGGDEKPARPNPPARQYLDLFRRYGEQYGVPWYILAALAFHESAYAPNAVSHAGAQGMMQFMPATWADMNNQIGVVDPFNPEESIHASAYYLNQIRRYLHKFNRAEWRYILGGYNAGPHRAATQPWESLPPETQRYAVNIITMSEAFRRWEDGW